MAGIFLCLFFFFAMNNLPGAIRRCSIFYFGYSILFILLAFFCFEIPKSNGFLLINRLHCALLDYFFILFTNLGDGLFAIAIVIFMLARRQYAWSLQLTVSFLLTGAVVQIFKRLVHNPRPQMFFRPHLIHFINGVTHTGYSSFPSGHAATIFALTTLLSIYFPTRKSMIFFLIIAVLTGFSRIYLSQHFPVDVLAGSVIGVLISTITYMVIPLSLNSKKATKSELELQSAKL
jgi:membrane-associated phospholipid phosphatase